MTERGFLESPKQTLLFLGASVETFLKVIIIEFRMRCRQSLEAVVAIGRTANWPKDMVA